MYELDSVHEIEEKELYHLRSVVGTLPREIPPEIKYFDFETQTFTQMGLLVSSPQELSALSETNCCRTRKNRTTAKNRNH
jgi:hypothetical protein